MSQPSGSKTIGPCPYCGETYKLTNYMRRSKNLQHDEKGRWLWNTHLISCHRKIKPHNARIEPGRCE